MYVRFEDCASAGAKTWETREIKTHRTIIAMLPCVMLNKTEPKSAEQHCGKGFLAWIGMITEERVQVAPQC